MTHRPIETVLAKLRKVRPNSDNSWTACCPAHDDRKPSLSVSVGDDGRVLLHCFAGCSSDDVRAALGLEWRDLHAGPVEDVRRGTRTSRAAHGPPRAEPTPAANEPSPTGRVFASLDEVREYYRRRLGEPSASWAYRDAGGEVLGEMLRWDTPNGKEIRPAFRFADGWRRTYPPVRPLFGIDRIGTEDRVFVVEGEKAAERLCRLGFPAVTSPQGSSSAGKADWSPIAGREVVILPDADEPGEAYAADVVEQLAGADRDVVVVKLPGLRPRSGDDVVEWIDDVHHGDEVAAARSLEELAAEAVWSARRRRPTLTAADVLDDPAWSRPPEVLRTGVPWFDGIQPFGGIERGTLTVVAAPPRCYKTSLMLFLAWRLAVEGRRVHWLATEMSRPQLVRKVVAMSAKVSPAVVADPRVPALVDRVATAVQGVRELGDRLVLGRAPITASAIASAAEDADVVLVDYLQQVQPDDGTVGSSRVDELDAVMRDVLAAIQGGATVIAAASLNRSGRDEVSLGSIRGSSAIEYGATTVYAATESLVGIDPEADGPNLERVSVEYRCVKQREGDPVPLRFDIATRLGPLPLPPEATA